MEKVEHVTVTIGGEAVRIPTIASFADLERVWPGIKARAATTDPLEQISASIAVLSAAVVKTRPEMTVAEIKRRVRIGADGDERPGMLAGVTDLLIASGLLPKPAEAAPES